jgi:hypothetical protein
MSSIGEIAQLITAIVLAFNCWQSWRNGRSIKQVAEQTDGINKQLVAVTAEKEFAAGVKHGEDHPREDGNVGSR